MLFREAAAQHLSRCGARASSVGAYQRRLAAVPELAELAVESITAGHVQDALAGARARGLAPASVRAVYAAVRAVLRGAGSRAADGLRLRVPQFARRALTPGECSRLAAAVRAPADLAEAVVAVLVATGLRIGEALALRRWDWQPDRRVLLVQAAKTAQGREVDVPDWAVEAVEVLLGSPRPPSRDTVRRRLAALLRGLDLPPIRVHDLRHSRITQLLLAGAPALYVSAQAGHHAPGYTLQVYGHLVAASGAQRRAWANAA